LHDESPRVTGRAAEVGASLAGLADFGKSAPTLLGLARRENAVCRPDCRDRVREPACLWLNQGYNAAVGHHKPAKCSIDDHRKIVPMTEEIPVNRKPLYAITAALTVSIPGTTFGQDVGPYDPLGIRAGAFHIYPVVSVEGQYDDNVDATKNNKRDDYAAIFSQNINVESDFSRHAVGFNVFSDVGRWLDDSKEDFWDFGINGSGRLDITGDNNLDANFGVARQHDNRDDSEDDATVGESRRPVRYMDYSAGLAYNHLLRNITLRFGGEFDRQNYRQGAGTANQNERDINQYTGLLRVGYNVSPRINTFVQGVYTVNRYDASRDSDGFKQDSEVYGGAGGVNVNFTDLLFGEAFVGYSQETFEESDFSDKAGLTYGLGLTWLPTRLTTVELSGKGGFEPTSNNGASTNLRHTVGLQAEHELFRQVVIGARAGYRRDDFQNTDRTDNRMDLGTDVRYLINRHFSVGAGYNFSKRWSDDDTREFDGNVFTVRVQAQL
jgi:hypothetical protein